MAIHAIRAGSQARQPREASARDNGGDPVIPPALGFLMACAASVAAWVGVLIAVYLLV
jgi:hypothetical protein